MCRLQDECWASQSIELVWSQVLSCALKAPPLVVPTPSAVQNSPLVPMDVFVGIGTGALGQVGTTNRQSHF